MTESSTPPSTSPGATSLGSSARASLLWGGGFTLLRDAAQFGVMLVLVRLLTPTDYGAAALAQAIIGLAAVVSFGTFSGHALQIRNPDEIDWQAHFTAAVVINTTLAAIVLLLAFALSFTTLYAAAALPLAALSLVFLIEIPGTLRHRMLEVDHDWKRFRLLLIIGTLLGLGSGLVVGRLGGGVWALIVQAPMLGLPATFDLLFIQRFRPDWSWSWGRWRETFRFGLDRIGAGLVGRSRVLNEQALLSSFYDLATLGIYGRATGLAMLGAGRIGSVAMMSLTPVVTRAQAGSLRFRRLADLVLRGVVWSTLPAAAFLGLAARDTVALLYGAQWDNVAVLLPLAACAIGLGGIVSAMASLLIANNGSRAALWLDVVAGVSAIMLAVALVPYGASIYLAGLGVHALVVVASASVLLVRRDALSAAGLASAFAPSLAAGGAGLAAALVVRRLTGAHDALILSILFDGLAFGAAYLVTLRLAFARPLAELLEVAPGGVKAARLLRIDRLA